jgi:hypothetical protein
MFPKNTFCPYWLNEDREVYNETTVDDHLITGNYLSCSHSQVNSKLGANCQRTACSDLA